jgi:fatty acid desaturase
MAGGDLDQAALHRDQRGVLSEALIKRCQGRVMKLLYVFSLATAAVVAAVWALGEIDAWWALVPAMILYVLSAAFVMHSVARTLASGDEPDAEPQAPAPAPTPARIGRLLPH